jgi:hypothetical protein
MNVHRLTTLTALVSILAACGHIEPGDTVRDARAAIEIARSQCKAPKGNLPPAENWNAQLFGDTWKVWLGPHDGGYGQLEVSVAKHDGKATDCMVWIG